MMRYQYTNAKFTSPSISSSSKIYFGNAGVIYPSKTHSLSFELKSVFRNKLSNNLKIGYTHTLDDRGPMGEYFPRIEIKDGDGTIILGGENYSSGNKLDQKILTITDNLQIYSGNHTFTVGTHNEFYSIYNLFMRNAFGLYNYNNLDQFINKEVAYKYKLGYSLIDNIRGDGSAAAADFNFFQLGAYIQDEWQVKNNLKITAGLRVDLPVYTKDPQEKFLFNQITLGFISKHYDIKGAKSGKMPCTQFLWSPRIGFNWDVHGDKTLQVRGGTGIFTSRTPFVWPAGSYTNNGMVLGEYYKKNDEVFNPNWQTQTKGGTDAHEGSQIDLYAENFKNPQMWRTNIAIDFKLPYDILATAEIIYTKTINNVLWKDINIKKAWGYATGTPDNRPLYKTYKNGIDPKYKQIILGDNTSKGYSLTASLQLSKHFNKNLNTSVSYTYGKTTSIFDGTSSQNSSQWNYLVSSPVAHNSAEVGISGFDMGHRIVAFVSYEKAYFKNLKTGISLYYNGQSGQRISYIYNDYYGSMTSESYKGPQLIYIPKTENEIKLVDRTMKDENDNIIVLATAAEEWADLDAYIKSNSYLNNHRGQYAERNGDRLPFTHMLNIKLTQDLYVNIKDRKQTLQLSLDIFNFANLLNKNWGAVYSAYKGNISLMKFESLIVDPDLQTTHELYGKKTLPTFTFKRPKDDKAFELSNVASRWQAMVTIRYIF
jgi:hypothetical protein